MCYVWLAVMTSTVPRAKTVLDAAAASRPANYLFPNRFTYGAVLSLYGGKRSNKVWNVRVYSTANEYSWHTIFTLYSVNTSLIATPCSWRIGKALVGRLSPRIANKFCHNKWTWTCNLSWKILSLIPVVLMQVAFHGVNCKPVWKRNRSRQLVFFFIMNYIDHVSHYFP